MSHEFMKFRSHWMWDTNGRTIKLPSSGNKTIVRNSVSTFFSLEKYSRNDDVSRVRITSIDLKWIFFLLSDGEFQWLTDYRVTLWNYDSLKRSCNFFYSKIWCMSVLHCANHFHFAASPRIPFKKRKIPACKYAVEKSCLRLIKWWLLFGLCAMYITAKHTSISAESSRSDLMHVT